MVFEAIGVPGIIDDVLRRARPRARSWWSACACRTTRAALFGITKELNVQFVLGYDPMEFAASLRSIAEGEIDVGP